MDKNARNFLYSNIAEHYTFNSKLRKWTPRVYKSKTYSRMYMVSPTDTERYCLRMLLLRLKGKTSFDELKTYNNVVYNTFQEACRQRHLLDDDLEWDKCLTNNAFVEMPYQLRQLFIQICLHSQPSDPLKLYQKHKNKMMEDYLANNMEYIAEQKLLYSLQILLKNNESNLQKFNLPKVTMEFPEFTTNLIDSRIKEKAVIQLNSLNEEQSYNYEQIKSAIDGHNETKLFLLDGPGGSGKTFLYNTILYNQYADHKKPIAVASTGLAATLIINAATYHSTFKIYPPISETSISQIKSGTVIANALKESSIIIWDEVTLAKSHCLNALDKLLKELMNTKQVFGGKVILIGNKHQIIKNYLRKVVLMTIKSFDL